MSGDRYFVVYEVRWWDTTVLPGGRWKERRFSVLKDAYAFLRGIAGGRNKQVYRIEFTEQRVWANGHLAK